MSHGGLPPRRPDQVNERTPRMPVPGARTTPIVNKPGVPIIVQDGGVPNMNSASQVNVGPQAPTGFHTFANNGRIWGAHLSFAAASNGSYGTGAITQLYARVRTASFFTICVIELCLAGPGQPVNGDGDPTFPGVPVLAGDALQLDVNNGIVPSNVLQRASVTVFFSVP